jgi:hypothetical protein
MECSRLSSGWAVENDLITHDPQICRTTVAPVGQFFM